MTRTLQLTSDQQSRLRPVLVSRREQLDHIRSDRSLSREGKSTKMRALDDDGNRKVLEILDGTQKTKYQAMIEKRKAQMAEQRAGAAR